MEAERLCLELQKNYREFGAGLALRQSVVTGNGRRKKTAASQLSSEDYLKLRWCLEKRSSLRLEKAYLHRWAVMKKIRTEVTEIFDELTTLSDYLTKGMSLEIDLKHTYLEYLPSHAKSLKVEVTYWAQIHQYILHNRWLKKAECLRAFWAQTRRYIATVAYVLKVIQQLMVGGLTMFTKISSNLQKLNIPTFTNDFCIATSDYNTVVKEISWIYDSLTLISPCHRTKLPATLSISEILTAVAKSDALIQSTLIIKELAIKPNSLLSNLKQMNFKDIFVRLNSQVQKPNGSSLPPIPTMKKATKPKKAVDGGTSDYSSMSGSTVSDGIETPDLESSLITSASSKALVAKLKSFHQQRNLVLSELLDSATKHRSIADSKLKTKPVKKGVSWLEDAVNEQKQEILLVYSQDFWMETAKHLNILLTYGSIGSYHLPKSSLNSSLAPALVAKSVSDMFQRGEISFRYKIAVLSLIIFEGLGEICSSLQQLPTVQALDYGWRLFEIGIIIAVKIFWIQFTRIEYLF